MATHENSTQFSLRELANIEEKRLQAEIEAARARAIAEVERKAQEDAARRRAEVAAEAKRAAERAAREARAIADQQLAEERARLASLPVEAPQPARPPQSWVALAAVFLSVLGLSVSVGYGLTQSKSPGVASSNHPISISTVTERPAVVPAVPAVASEPEASVEKKPNRSPDRNHKAGTSSGNKGGDTRKPCPKSDPLCGIGLDGE